MALQRIPGKTWCRALFSFSHRGTISPHSGDAAGPGWVKACENVLGNHRQPSNLSSIRHSSTIRFYDSDEDPPERGPKKWLKHNDKVYPPQQPGDEKRPAFVCHMKTNLKYSPWKLWYIASMVRGMSVDEAVKQLTFINKKGAAFVRDAILEAQEVAVKEHNVEFRSNLWISDSFVGKGVVIKGMRRHARGRMGRIEYFHCHYFVRLEEGAPPVDYFQPRQTGPEMLEDWIADLRNRNIIQSL